MEVYALGRSGFALLMDPTNEMDFRCEVAMTTIPVVRKKSNWKRRFGWSALALTGVAACMQWRSSGRRTRIEDRVLCSDLLPIRWQEEKETHETIGNLEEIWPAGAVILLEEDLAAAQATLVTPAQEFRGRVVARWHDETGYFVELRFLSDRWSKDIYTPDHSLDLASIQSAANRSNQT
jgi:hypothetical protein